MSEVTILHNRNCSTSRLMQRPVLLRGDRAIIGRPKDRVAQFLTDA